MDNDFFETDLLNELILYINVKISPSEQKLSNINMPQILVALK